MYDELTAVDIKKMREELDHRVRVLRPQLIEEVQTARAFGDLSENFEYKCAKQAKNRNDSRIRYLERMMVRIVTTLRQDALKGLVSKESPVGKAILGRRAGDRVEVEVNPNMKYFLEIRGIEKGEDDETLDISAY